MALCEWKDRVERKQRDTDMKGERSRWLNIHEVEKLFTKVSHLLKVHSFTKDHNDVSLIKKKIVPSKHFELSPPQKGTC